MSARRCRIAPAARLAALAVPLAAAAAAGQSAPARPGLIAAVRGDSVILLVTDAPAAPSGGLVVYRNGVRLTTEPLRPERDPALAAAAIGAELPEVMAAVRAADEGEMLRRLRGDPFAGALVSALFPRAGAVLGRVFVDTAARAGAEYEYRLVRTGADGREPAAAPAGGARALALRVRVAEAPIAAPTALQARPGDQEVTLTWRYPRYAGDPRDVVVGFHVYRAEPAGGAGGGEPRRLTTTPVLRDDAAPALRYTDREAANGREYRYVVRAVDIARREGPASAAALARPLDRAAPAAPALLVARAGEGAALLSWRMSPEHDAAGYHVERSTGLSRPFTRLTTRPVAAGEPAFADSALAGGTQYFYRIVALDSAGNASRPSNPASVVPHDRTPPRAPSGVSATVRERRLTVRWAASPSRDVIGYYVYRGDTRERLVRLVSRPVAGTAFVDSGFEAKGLVPGHRYALSVSAVDASYNESEKAPAEVAVPDDAAPAAPTGLRARNVRGRYAEVSWSASPSLDVAAYVLTRRELAAPGGADSLGRFATVPRTPVRDTVRLRHGRRYVYALFAVDSAGNRGPALADTMAFGDLEPPPAPQRVAVAAAGAAMRVSWQRVVAHELAGYHVYRSTHPTGVFERLTTAPVTALAWVDRAGRPDHYYHVRAVDASRNESAPSPAERAQP